MADFGTPLFAGVSIGAVVGALLNRSVAGPWRTVLADASVGMVGAMAATFVSDSEWLKARAANRSILDPALSDPIIGLFVDHPLVVAGVVAAAFVVLWRGVRASLERRGFLVPSASRK